MELDAERFKSVKELADIQAQIAAGRAEVIRLKEEKDAYIEAMRIEAVGAVRAALEASNDALREAESNKDALVSFLAQVRECAENVGSLADAVKTAHAEYETDIGQLERVVSDKTEEVAQASDRLRKQRLAVESEMGALNVMKRELSDRERKLKDKEGMINRKIERFKQGRV